MMAFHVACPITCQRICYCTLGFPHKLQTEKSKKNFLEEIFRVEDYVIDPWLIKAKESSTVQVVVPKVVVAPPPPSQQLAVAVPGTATTTVVVSGDGGGIGVGGEVEELLSFQSKRIELQKRAVAASIAAEDYARKFETGALALDNTGETVRDIVGGEDTGVKVMCRICFDGENEGSERAHRMRACKHCNKKYHRSCLKTWGQHRDLFHLSSWVCPSCRTCEVCLKAGDPTKFMFCKRCDGASHCYCLRPIHKNVSHGPYVCPKHTRCHSCGSNVPGNGPSTRWFLGYTCCDACGRLFVKGNYCPVCLKVYRDSESTPMVCCDVCQRWVHCQCDGISDEKYLQFQADGNLYYKCAACRGACYQIKGPAENAIPELWRRRDKADRDQIASLRAATGLPSEEAFSDSIHSDDDDVYSPLKFSVKGSAHKGTKNTKEYGKKLSNKKHGKKKENQVSLMGKTDAHQHYEGPLDTRSINFTLADEKNDDMRFYKGTGMDRLLSSPCARSPGNTKEKCSINQAGIMKHDFKEEVVAYNEYRPPKVAQMKSSKSHDPVPGFGFVKHANKSENVKGKKLVITIARNKNVNNSPKSEASKCPKEQDVTSYTGSEDTSQQKANKKYAIDRNDETSRSYDAKGEKSGKAEQLTYSRAREVSSMKLGKLKSEVSDFNRHSGKGNITDGSTAAGKTHVILGRSKEGTTAASERVTKTPAVKTDDLLRRHSIGTPDVPTENQDNNTLKVSGLNTMPKDTKQGLKVKFKNLYLDNRSPSVPQEEGKISTKGQRSKDEEKSSTKGQRSKRKKPEKNHVLEEEEEEDEEQEQEEGNTRVHQDGPVKEVMDASWILTKLGKDAIGKRVEVHQPSDSSWHKGEVTDMIKSTSTLVVRLDDGRVKTLELGKQAIRLVPLKQKRTKTSA